MENEDHGWQESIYFPDDYELGVPPTPVNGYRSSQPNYQREQSPTITEKDKKGCLHIAMIIAFVVATMWALFSLVAVSLLLAGG